MRIRNSHGNMLILIVATIFAILAIALFALGFVRLMGSHSEQKTAIEAASLAAARDLSKIVVNTDEFGFIGLSDSAPIGAQTEANDQWYVPVNSINSIIGTARLSYIAASAISDGSTTGIPAWQELAKMDITRAQAAAAALESALQSAITPTGSGVDVYGNVIEPYKSAENAYKNNQIRMTGSSNYVPGSLTLELGSINGGSATNVPLPKQTLTTDSALSSTTTVGNFYKSYVNVPFGGEDFVFAGIGNAINLVDTKKWVSNVAGLPYQVHTIVKAEAEQQVDDPTTTRTIKATACAQPASITDPKNAPGALVIGFPDGMPDDGAGGTPDPDKDCPAKPFDLMVGSYMLDGDDDSDFYYSSSGDYPVEPSSSIEYETLWPLASYDPDKKAGNCCALAIYDWMRRAGTKLNLDSLQGALTTPFQRPGGTVVWPNPLTGLSPNPVPIPQGWKHIYRIVSADPNPADDGKVDYAWEQTAPTPYASVADNQILVECHECIKDESPKHKVKPIVLGPPLDVSDGEIEHKKEMDMYIRMYARKVGAIPANPSFGGNHAGEPIDENFSTFVPRVEKIACSPTFGTAVLAPLYRVGYGAKAVGAKGIAATVGKGALPSIGPREDFAFSLTGPASWGVNRSSPMYRTYTTYTAGPKVRPTYSNNGVVTEIRFRRLLKAKKGLVGVMGGEDGYVMDK